jgi:transposase
MREVFDAIVYVTRTGCAWRLLPHDFPPWGTVWFYFRKWRNDGTLETMHDRLRERVRRREKRHREPRIAVLDSQSVKTSDQAGERGFDAGKKGQGPQAALAR